MTTKSPPKVRSWDHPACPECNTDVFVDATRGGTTTIPKYECQFCGEVFDA